mmetsp:Transcript_369/g.1229  ORF Transcript_369/g.1229 Transcript_369/m.1229 type:complete len:482 (-) Transcript_369:22-1467(-)
MSTAKAWGLDRMRPLCFSLSVCNAHYSRSASQRLEVAPWQERTVEGCAPLDAGVQLANVAKHFWSHLCGTAAVGAPLPGDAIGRAPPKHLMAKRASWLDEAKASDGLLLPLATYLAKRLSCLHEYCVICDAPQVFPPLLKPTVCTRTLCCYSARMFGAAVTGKFSGQCGSLEVWDLLVALCICSRQMPEERMRVLFAEENFPVLLRPGSSQRAFGADDAGFAAFRALLDELAEHRAEQVAKHGISWLGETLREEGGAGRDELLGPLLEWVWESNRSYILALPREARLPFLGTPYQYLLLSAPPEQEVAFQGLKREHGSEFCFHGSSSTNWHCILRQGLRNTSGTQLMTAGQTHGPGIYLARDSQTSAVFSAQRPSAHVAKRPAPAAEARETAAPGQGEPQAQEATGERLHDPGSLLLLAVCEVALVPTLRRVNHIWVCPEEAAVVTRFLLVYRDTAVPKVLLEDPAHTWLLRQLADKWTQP